MIKEDEGIVEGAIESERGGLRAHRLINMIQDKVRQQMITEMKLEDDGARDERLQRRLDEEVAIKEFKRQQRQALMPMYRNHPDFIDLNHNRTNFIPERQERIVTAAGRSFVANRAIKQ